MTSHEIEIAAKLKTISSKRLADLAPHRALIEVLRASFNAETVSPERHVHTIERIGEPDNSFLLMPAWQDMSGKSDSEKFVGLKSVLVLPGNVARNQPTVQASYQLFDGENGKLLALLDGGELTLRRTAAASALAADYLARKDAQSLLMIGAGALAPHLVAAHSSVRPIKSVAIYNRNKTKAIDLANSLSEPGFSARVVEDLPHEVAKADIISSATTSTEPIILGKWLKPGVHIDLVGAFTPHMRETDGHTIARSDVYVDTREGAIAEAGDLIQAAAEGQFTFEDIQADLFDLTAKTVSGRISDQQNTLFKSCGAALEDLACAIYVYKQDLAKPDNLL